MRGQSPIPKDRSPSGTAPRGQDSVAGMDLSPGINLGKLPSLS